MRNNNALTNLFLALLFFVSACKDNEDNPAPGSGSKDCRVTEMKLDDETISCIYTNDLLTQVKSISTNAADNENYTLEYNANKQITKAQLFNPDGSSDFYIAYEYNTAGLVSKNNYFYTDSSGTAFANDLSVTFEYTDKTLTRTTTLEDLSYLGIEATVPVNSTVYTINAGNVTKTTYYILDENWLFNLDPNNLPPTTEYMNHMVLSGSTEYQYDDKKNAFQPLSFISFLLEDVSALSVNNITSRVDKDETGSTSNTTTTTYVYNAEGYPTQITSTETGSTAETIAISYSCQ